MGRRKKTIMTPGGPLEVEPVDVVGSQENFSTYNLEDGAVLRVKNVVMEVYRVPSQKDLEGNQAYVIQSNLLVKLVSAPTQ